VVARARTLELFPGDSPPQTGSNSRYILRALMTRHKVEFPVRFRGAGGTLNRFILCGIDRRRGMGVFSVLGPSLRVYCVWIFLIMGPPIIISPMEKWTSNELLMLFVRCFQGRTLKCG